MNEIQNLDLPAVGENRRMGWVSDAAAEVLRRLGIRYIALNPGASYRGLHDSLVNYLGNRDPQMLLCLHEDHPIAIAHGYAKVTGEPMAAVVHSNVGLLHGLMSVFNAWCDRMPVYLLGATGPVDAQKRRPWIDWIHTSKDQGALLRNFTKWDDEPRSPQALVEALLRGAVMARTPPQGPVYLCLDAGLQESELDAPVEIPEVERFAPGEPQAASTEAVERAADMLLVAATPLIMMGRMSRSQDDWDARRRLAELLGARVVTDIKIAATFPTDHPLHVGAPSLWPREDRNAAIKEADAVLSLDWVDLDGSFKSAGLGKDVAAKVISCSVDIHAHNGWSMDYFGLAPSDLTVHADPDRFVAQLLPVIEARLGGEPRWSGTAQAAETPRPERTADAPLSTTDIGLALNAARAGRQLTLTRVTLGWDATVYPFRDPLDYTGHDGGAGLGGAPGITIGVGLALKGTGRLPVAVMGDGEFIQGVTALWTAARYKIPALFIVANNRSNFNDEIHQETTAKLRGRPVENKWIGQRIDDPAIDIAGLARAQGIEAEGPVETWEALQQAIETGLTAVADGRPYLIDVSIEPGYSTPLVTRG
jgi:thiamine pyrophosphate-dependent acetolactate synthase large subunit-like protein